MLGTYVYFDEPDSLHLFRREASFVPVGTIEKVERGKATIRLWAPLILEALSCCRQTYINASLTHLSRPAGMLLVESHRKEAASERKSI